MKAFFQFIIAAVIYLIVGLIVWNIYCSNIEISSKRITQLATERLFIYTATTGAITYIVGKLRNFDEMSLLYFAIILGINFVIAVVVNYWESVWESVSIIFAIIYNVVNILALTIIIFAKD